MTMIRGKSSDPVSLQSLPCKHWPPQGEESGEWGMGPCILCPVGMKLWLVRWPLRRWPGWHPEGWVAWVPGLREEERWLRPALRARALIGICSICLILQRSSFIRLPYPKTEPLVLRVMTKYLAPQLPLRPPPQPGSVPLGHSHWFPGAWGWD